MFLLTSFLAAWLAPASPAGNGARAATAIELESLLNTSDGSVLRGCRLHDEIEGGGTHQSWLSFGEIRQGEVPPLEVVSTAIRCRTGSSKKVASLFGRRLGTPYLILDIEAGVRDGKLHASIAGRKFSKWDGQGRPVYAQLERRTLQVGEEAVVPILVAEASEKEAFRVDELFLRLRAATLGQRETVYGAISLTSDTPGAFLLLDGGSVHRSLETGPTLIENVRAGRHDLILRDFSGREARKSLEVEKEKTVEISLSLREPPPSGKEPDRVPVGKNPEGYEELWRSVDGALVVTIPAGETWMGSDEGEGEANEHPKHRVFVPEFRIDKTEVTWRQFQRFVRATGATLLPAPVWGMPDDFPASNVNWEEASAYCKWVGGRLPTEAEWEKADRGTDGRKYPWGSDWIPGRCNCLDGGPHRPENVGSFPDCRSPYGVMDMPGSVWEWCSDWYAETYDPAAPSRDPHGPESGSMRVARGGGWVNQPTWLRSAYRYRAEPRGRHPNHGFRCAEASAP